ncbi:MAG TPA: STY0301 family protein [Roseomonas sp.]|jgi:hypothetical protein
MRVPLLALLALLPLPALAQGRPAAPAPAWSCPASIEVDSTARIRVPDGFTLMPDPTRYWLRGADMFDGPPAEMAQLRGDSDRRTRRDWWDLDPANPRRYFIICRYEGLEEGLQATLPEGLRRCTMETYRENAQAGRGGRTVVGPDGWVRVTCAR